MISLLREEIPICCWLQTFRGWTNCSIRDCHLLIRWGFFEPNFLKQKDCYWVTSLGNFIIHTREMTFATGERLYDAEVQVIKMTSDWVQSSNELERNYETRIEPLLRDFVVLGIYLWNSFWRPQNEVSHDFRFLCWKFFLSFEKLSFWKFFSCFENKEKEK